LVTNQNINEDDYSICLNPKCNIIYFSPNSIYDKNTLPVKVWFKETMPPVPVCYCKNVTDQDIIEHILVHKCCNSLEDIQKHTGANTGKECLTKNPTGK
jgi:predicted transcriptional regulator